MKDEDLVHLIKRKPEEGIKMLMSQYSRPVYTICSNFLASFAEEDIDEAVADSFVKLWKNIDKFDVTRGTSLKSYLFEIARNTAIDTRRKRKMPELFALDEVMIESDVDIESDYIRKEHQDILHQVLNDFREPDKSIFILRYFYGERVKNIADSLELSPKKVENILLRGKERLKKALLERGMTYDTDR